MTRKPAGMLTLLDDGLWEADARLELEEVADDRRRPPDRRGRRVDTIGGLAFLLAGRILQPGESVVHPSGWRLEASNSDSRRITASASTHPTPRPDRAVSPVANKLAGSAMALNSSALPAGSSRNIVACSPGSPAKRTVGGMTKAMPAAFEPLGQRGPLGHFQHQPEMRHRHVLAIDRVACRAARRIGREMSDDLVAVEVEVDPALRAPALRAAERAP